ncbi:hypothetical protein LguiA_034131 [Lonicera macranthoides]
MASNPPPLQVEDQTDEDFFDNLVNDEDDDFKGIASSGPKLGHGNVNDNDELKAFSHLSNGEIGTGSRDLTQEVASSEAKEEAIDGNVKAVSTGSCIEKSVDAHTEKSVEAHIEESCSSLVSSPTSYGFASVIESNNGMTGTDVASDSITSKSGASASLGIKEVQWSAFNTDSGQNGSSGFGLYSDFFGEYGDSAVEKPQSNGDNFNCESKVVSGNEENESPYLGNTYNYEQYQEDQVYDAATEQSSAWQDQNSSQYWENLYPGWKYDHNTGQWYQVDSFDLTANVQGSFESNSASDWAVSENKSEVSYLQQTTQSVMGTVAESGTIESVTSLNNPVSQSSDNTESVSNWNEVSQANNGYPSHMVFDPQYPGWYYDMIAQEWRSLDAYTAAQSALQTQDQLNLNGHASTYNSYEINQKTLGEHEHVGNYGSEHSEGLSSQEQNYNSDGSFNNFNQQGSTVWQPRTSEFGGNKQTENQFDPNFSVNNHVGQRKSYDYRGAVPFYEKSSQGRSEFSDISGSQGFVPGGNSSHQLNQPLIEKNEHMNVSNDYYANKNTTSYSQQPFQSVHQFSSYTPAVGRSSASRPPHALVTFGFGGKLIVMNDNATHTNSAYGTQDPASVGSISVLNLMEVVNEKAATSRSGTGFYDYFRTLSQQSFPGPLTGGNVGVKELNKWIDERITRCDSSDMDYRKVEVLKLLLSLLKIACQHYGKLRSPFGTDTTLRESNAPESAVARLFSSAKRNGPKFSEYGALSNCLQKLPSEGQMLETAAEVQTLLVSGRKKEALHRAKEGQLWGPALVLAAQLGDQFYVDTVKQMALRQLVAGSPLRTLCLLIAGQPADVFSTYTTADSGIYNAVNMPQQTGQISAKGMLDDWEENLAMITANRTKDDELVLIHLGDCLWKERSNILAAHICYLVAEANFEPYSDSARLCLIGSDHWKFPRTYACPEAIQRTEIYEYSKVLGNSQFILVPFQPYKLIYAHMLAEVGRVSDSLKYCQAILKFLKTGRSPEVETWRQLALSLEERIRTHQQGGFSTNLGPSKLVGKLLNLFDSTAHRVVGGLPPPVPSTLGGSAQVNEHYQQLVGPRVSSSQSTMAMSSLMPSASADKDRKIIHNRSVSEPDIGRTTRQDQVVSSKEATSQNKASVSGSASRFSRFGFGSQLLQKTVGLVLKRQDRQAKLGETNKFYYDEKLKRWVEEGADQPAEEAALPPPPTIAAFPNGSSNYNLKSALKGEGSHQGNGNPEYKSPTHVGHSSGIPPIPTSSNQFSARGRTGVRSRYVDTFNQGGGNPTNLFHSPSVPSLKPTTTSSNPKFFVPTTVSSSFELPVNTTSDSMQQTASINENSSDPTTSHSFQKYGSMDDITKKGPTPPNGNHHAISSSSLHSRRTLSWSGGNFSDPFSPPTTQTGPFSEGFSGHFSPPNQTEIKPLGEVLGMPPSTFMNNDTHSSMNGGRYGEDLHEVEL